VGKIARRMVFEVDKKPARGHYRKEEMIRETVRRDAYGPEARMWPRGAWGLARVLAGGLLMAGCGARTGLETGAMALQGSGGSDARTEPDSALVPDDSALSDGAVILDALDHKDGGTPKDTNAPDNPPPPATPHHCTGKLVVHSPIVISLPSAFGGNVQIGQALQPGTRALLSWGSRECCGSGPFMAQAGLIDLDAKPKPTAVSLFTDVAAPPMANGWPPPLARVAGGVLLLNPRSGAQQGVLVDESTLAVKQTVSVALDFDWFPLPAIAGRTGGVIAITWPGPRLRRLDDAFALVDDVGIGWPYDGGWWSATVTPTNVGALATWTLSSHGLFVLPLLPDGAMAAAESLIAPGEPAWTAAESRSAAWDGAHVVTVDGLAVYEIDAAGVLAARTPTQQKALAAVGTDEGVLAMLGAALKPNGTGGRLALLERGSGVVIKSLGDLVSGYDYATTAGVFARPGEVIFAASSIDHRDQAIIVRVTCP
jgi:hypothetical protein